MRRILAIILVISVPMMVRYVERSRISTDIQAVGSMGQALKTAAIDPVNAVAAGGLPPSLTLTWEANGDVRVNNPVYQAAVHSVVGSNVNRRSQTLGRRAVVTITMPNTAIGSIFASQQGASGINTNYVNELLLYIN